MPDTEIAENSKRIARNTLLLYFRMLLMLFIGLFTSRVILRALGVVDYGVYNVVGGAVTVFTFVTNSVSTAITRFLSFELGKSDTDGLRRAFASSVLIQIGIALTLVILVESGGVWLLHHKLDIPVERMGAATFTLHCSLGVLVVTLLAVPYNAVIVAREKMGAYAAISLLEAGLKLMVAGLLYLSVFDKLKSYAVLMLAVSILVRLVYGWYCRSRYPETRGRLDWDGTMVRKMTAFSAWSFFGSSSYVLNTQGINLLSNIFFGVVINAARGIATQVEGITKQFVSNMLTAFNPQITKSWASGNREYSFTLVRYASKYAYLIILTLMLPLSLESSSLLRLWLGNVPQNAALFVSLTFLSLLELVSNPLHTLQLATGRVSRYFLITGTVSYLTLPLVWVFFKVGAPAQWAYYLFFSVYLLVGVLRAWLVHIETAFPLWEYLRILLRLLLVTLCSLPLPVYLRLSMPEGFTRIALVFVSAWSCVLLSSWLLVLGSKEKNFILSKIRR